MILTEKVYVQSMISNKISSPCQILKEIFFHLVRFWIQIFSTWTIFEQFT